MPKLARTYAGRNMYIYLFSKVVVQRYNGSCTYFTQLMYVVTWAYVQFFIDGHGSPIFFCTYVRAIFYCVAADPPTK